MTPVNEFSEKYWLMGMSEVVKMGLNLWVVVFGDKNRPTNR
jgi:hypothetical protein